MINYTTAAEAAKLIKSNDSVYIQGSVSIPEVLVKAMADRGHELRGVKVYSAFAIGREEAPYCKPEYKDSFLVYSLFVSNSVRNWIAQGYGQAIPAFLGEIPGLFRKGIIPIDVALLNCSAPMRTAIAASAPRPTSRFRPPNVRRSLSPRSTPTCRSPTAMR